MTAPYNADGLWMKAKLFINRAMDDDERTFDERAMWASLGLELLAKAALSRVSPLLIATPQEDGINLLIAAGVVSGDERFKSIPAHTVFSRCGRAFKPFNEKEAMNIATARNEYLHSASIGFTVLPEETWWARYWAQVAILVDHLDDDLDGLVGSERVATVQRFLALNARNIEMRLESLIERAKQRLALRDSASPPAWIIRDFAKGGDVRAGRSYSTSAECPACGGLGLLEGEDVSAYEIQHEGSYYDDYDAWVDLTVDADYFGCPECRLVLDGYELLEQAGLDTTFSDIGDVSNWVEDDYGND